MGKVPLTVKNSWKGCVRSIDDVKVSISMNVAPLNKLIAWLKLFESESDSVHSLAIRSGSEGAMLSHSHEQQCRYAMESLVLWKIVQSNIFEFWECVDRDMLLEGGGSYRFCDTGQGYQRVCGGAKTAGRMRAAVSEAQSEMHGWQGITVIHMGDRDVPNPLVFIDKYTIIPQMLGPVVSCIEKLEEIFDSTRTEAYPGLRNLLKAKYGDPQKLRTIILRDFYRHAFDGSGDDGGSCIDGRLTSAWNWCQLLHKKSYYLAFVLTGFNGFDG